uniref:Ska2 N-terminal domain-containing protein n=1 Tax=Salarias fasciatus TaxID=181472 RepID=A0A672FE29_SALFA
MKAELWGDRGRERITYDLSTFLLIANPVLMLDKLKVMKAKHSSLCSKVKEISAAQKESMNFITINFNHATEVVQNLQKTADVQVPLQAYTLQNALVLSLKTLVQCIEC